MLVTVGRHDLRMALPTNLHELDADALRQLLIALAMISVMLIRPRGLWPAPEHGKARKIPGPGKDVPASVKTARPALTNDQDWEQF